MAKTFPSKVDTWLLVVLALSAVPAAIGAVGALRAGAVVDKTIAAVAATIGLGLPLWVLARTDYTVDEAMLHIRSGPFRWHVPVQNIVSVNASRNLLSSPALSLDRIELVLVKGRALRVSPEDRAGFCRALLAIHPGLQVHVPM